MREENTMKYISDEGIAYTKTTELQYMGEAGSTLKWSEDLG